MVYDNVYNILVQKLQFIYAIREIVLNYSKCMGLKLHFFKMIQRTLLIRR